MTLTRQRRDKIRAFANICKNEDAQFDCAPQTILSMLDVLDAAESAEPVAWAVEGTLRDGGRVLRLPFLTTKADADRYAQQNPDEVLARLYAAPTGGQQ